MVSSRFRIRNHPKGHKVAPPGPWVSDPGLGRPGAQGRRRAAMSQSPQDDAIASRPRDFVSSSSMSVHTLPEGTRLLDYEITGLIGEGGFGIVYLAYDHSLQRRVAIKEYLPAAMASRANASAAVVVKSDRHLDTFRLGLKSFVNEARLL